MKFIITVDTEADNQWKSDEVSLNNINFLPRFQSLCEKFSFTPSYLLSYEVLKSESAVRMLKTWQKQGRAEIGAHLHPWTTPPFDNGSLINKEHSFPCELEDKQLLLKLETLTKAIKEKFGFSPTSFRAGRWGLDHRVANYLLELGYLVDCSITPKISWQNTKGLKGGSGGPDFRQAPIFPYFLNKKNINKVADNGLLEIPMTIIYTGKFIKEGKIAFWFASLPPSFLKKVLNKFIFKMTWCRIFPESKVKDLIAVYKSAQKNNLPVLEFMIHSSELMPGGSPYAKTDLAVEHLYKKLELFFSFLKENNIKNKTLTNFAKEYQDI